MGLIDKLRRNNSNSNKNEYTVNNEEKEEINIEKEPIKEEEGEGEIGRIKWASPTEFMLTCVGYSVGLGNVWRFPYLCYKSGGGAFLIPYMVMIALIGAPGLFMEYSFGQFWGIGGLSIFKRVCPLFKGIGICYMILNGFVCIYYNVIIAISIYYLIGSFTKNLPWGSCGHSWNTELCGDMVVNSSTLNESLYTNQSAFVKNMTLIVSNATNLAENITRISPSKEYWEHELLNVNPDHSINYLGKIRWHLCLCLLLAWIIVVVFVSKGIQSTGKVAYFTATFPYLMLTVLVVRGVTLKGATAGILYFVTPQWEKLLSPEIWFAAATQLFYSTNIGWGGMITMASYNDRHHKCFRDALIINMVSFGTSLYAGFAVFSIIGFMASESNIDVKDVIKSGPELAFIVYPRALSLMPLAPMWSALFFFMLFLLGIGSQMVLVETLITGFVDEFPALGVTALKRFGTLVVFAVVMFTIAVPQTTQMVQVETVMTGLMDEFPDLGKTRLHYLGTLFIISNVGFLMGLPCTTQMVGLETVMTGICDEFKIRIWWKRLTATISVATFMFCCGLPQTTQGGMFVLQLFDHYAASFSVLLIAFLEFMIIYWIYGGAEFSSDIKVMLGYPPNIFFRVCWAIVSPAVIVAVIVFSFIKYSGAKYGEYIYPWWADFLGWCMSLSSVIPIFAFAAYTYWKADGKSFSEKFKNCTKSIGKNEKNKVVELKTITLLDAGDMDA